MLSVPHYIEFFRHLNFAVLRKFCILTHLKGPLKYLVATLHSCYPNAISLPVSQNIFARFLRRRPVADSSRSWLFFLLRCNKHKKNFSFSFLLINFLLYGYNMWVVPLFLKLECFAWKCNQRTDVNRKPQRWLHVDEEISNSWLYKISSVRLEIEILKLRRHKLKFVLRYYHLQTSKNSEFAAFLAAPKLPDVFCDKTATLWTCIRELSFRTDKLRPLFRYNTNKRSYGGH